MLQINLTIDWNESPLDYTCYGERYEPKPFLAPVESHDLIPTDYHVSSMSIISGGWSLLCLINLLGTSLLHEYSIIL